MVSVVVVVATNKIQLFEYRQNMRKRLEKIVKKEKSTSRKRKRKKNCILWSVRMLFDYWHSLRQSPSSRTRDSEESYSWLNWGEGLRNNLENDFWRKLRTHWQPLVHCTCSLQQVMMPELAGTCSRKSFCVLVCKNGEKMSRGGVLGKHFYNSRIFGRHGWLDFEALVDGSLLKWFPGSTLSSMP